MPTSKTYWTSRKPNGVSVRVAGIDRARERAGLLGRSFAVAALGRLSESIKTREIIEQAKGIIIAPKRCSADEAFNILKQKSQATNTKVRTIAQELVDNASEQTASFTPLIMGTGHRGMHADAARSSR